MDPRSKFNAYVVAINEAKEYKDPVPRQLETLKKALEAAVKESEKSIRSPSFVQTSAETIFQQTMDSISLVKDAYDELKRSFDSLNQDPKKVATLRNALNLAAETYNTLVLGESNKIAHIPELNVFQRIDYFIREYKDYKNLHDPLQELKNKLQELNDLDSDTSRLLESAALARYEQKFILLIKLKEIYENLKRQL